METFTGSTNTQPSLEQIQNYKHFLLAKEECAKRIAEERQQQVLECFNIIKATFMWLS